MLNNIQQCFFLSSFRQCSAVLDIAWQCSAVLNSTQQCLSIIASWKIKSKDYKIKLYNFVIYEVQDSQGVWLKVAPRLIFLWTFHSGFIFVYSDQTKGLLCSDDPLSQFIVWNNDYIYWGTATHQLHWIDNLIPIF